MATWKVFLVSYFVRVGIVSVLAKSCGPLPDIPYGNIEYSNGVELGSIANISCEEGYYMVGKNQRVCYPNGWDHQNPICEAVLCDHPPEIEDGEFDLGSSGDIKFGTVATYKCKKFQLIGEATIYCTTSGNWSNLPPICKVVKCPDPHVANGQKTSNFGPTYRYLESTAFECKPGYVMTGPSRIVCKEDNNWDPSPPTCEHEGEIEKKNHIGLAVGITVAVIVLVVSVPTLIWYLKKKDGGSYKTTEEKMSPAPSVNTSSQQYSALQNKEASI